VLLGQQPAARKEEEEEEEEEEVVLLLLHAGLGGCSESPYSISRCRVEVETIDSWLAAGPSALERLSRARSPLAGKRGKQYVGSYLGIAFSGPHLTSAVVPARARPQIQPSILASPHHTAQHGNCH
jgi:hypothetical protein